MKEPTRRIGRNLLLVGIQRNEFHKSMSGMFALSAYTVDTDRNILACNLPDDLKRTAGIILKRVRARFLCVLPFALTRE